MNFQSFLIPSAKSIIESEVEAIQKYVGLNEAKQTPEEILRKAKYKINLVTPTKFGTQIDFSKKYDEGDIKELLKDYTLKFNLKSLFIIE